MAQRGTLGVSIPRWRAWAVGVVATGTALGTALTAGVLTAGPALAQPETEALDVPTPDDDESVITVAVGADRATIDGDVNGVTPLQGASLGLFASDDAPEPVDPAWGVCVSDADGDCSFVVPDTDDGGENYDRRFYVRQLDEGDGGVPDGWYTNPALRTGSGTGTGSQPTPYQFQTQEQLRGGNTYESGTDFMGPGGNQVRTASGGVWQQSRNNPPMPDRCGIDIALVLDISGSIGDDLPDLKATADGFADALVGTPSRMAAFSFSTDSPGVQGENYPELIPVSTDEGADEFKGQYQDWGSNGGTNWDRALATTSAAEPTYDLAVMITDGNPTFSHTPAGGPGNFTRLQEMEGGIFSANTLKNEGTRTLAVGVGSGIDEVTELNLRALSGQTEFDGSNALEADYFNADDFDAVGQALHDLMQELCSNSLNVVKEIVPKENTGEDITGAAPAGPGWNITADAPNDDVGGLPDTQTTTDDGTGTVTFPLTFEGGADTAEVAVHEEQRDGYTLVTQDGQNAVCRDFDGEPIPIENDDSDPENPGFTLDMPIDDVATCTIYNRPPPDQDVVVDKVWDIDGDSFEEGDQPDGFDAQLTLTGPGDEGASDQDWGTPREGYEVGEEATIDETVTVPDQCTVDLTQVTEINGELAAVDVPHDVTVVEDGTHATVTNTVTCEKEARLTLEKNVENTHGGEAGPEDWTLIADGPTPISGVSGTEEVTNVEVEEGGYVLSEADGPEGYVASDWICRWDGGEEPTEGAEVEITPGDDVTCSIANSDTEPEPTPSPSPTPEPTPGPGASEPDGGLPVTGGALIGLASLGLLLVGSGTAAVWWARKRRFLPWSD